MGNAVFRVAKEFDVVTIKSSKAADDRRDRLLEEGQCLGCERAFLRDKDGKVVERVTCGLCSTCYNAVLRKEKKNKGIRKELAREGKMLSPTDGGRRPANKFTRELAEK